MNPKTGPRDACRTALDAAARDFRLGMEAAGNECFVSFVDALMVVLADPGPEDEALAVWLPEIVAAQERGDFLRVADVLEYEVRGRL